MLNFMMTASFKYVIETDKVALDISIGISDAVTYSCLGCEIYNHGNVIFSEDFIYSFFVGNRGVDKSPVTIHSLYLIQTFIFDIDIIVIGNRINAYHFNVLYIVEKTLYEIAADKACCTCYEDGLALKVYIML